MNKLLLIGLLFAGFNVHAQTCSESMMNQPAQFFEDDELKTEIATCCSSLSVEDTEKESNYIKKLLSDKANNEIDVSNGVLDNLLLCSYQLNMMNLDDTLPQTIVSSYPSPNYQGLIMYNQQPTVSVEQK